MDSTGPDWQGAARAVAGTGAGWLRGWHSCGGRALGLAWAKVGISFTGDLYLASVKIIFDKPKNDTKSNLHIPGHTKLWTVGLGHV